jgi:hypothetical protein
MMFTTSLWVHLAWRKADGPSWSTETCQLLQCRERRLGGQHTGSGLVADLVPDFSRSVQPPAVFAGDALPPVERGTSGDSAPVSVGGDLVGSALE